MIILRPKNVIFERFWPLSKFDFLACSTLYTMKVLSMNLDRMIAAGFDNGDIKLFDLRAMAIQWSTNVLNGVCALQFDRLGNKTAEQ